MIDTKIFECYFNQLDLETQHLSLSLVEALQQRHIAEFSFNSLAVLLGQPVSLDIEDVINKVVLNRQGGYCFEHNKLIHYALSALGFDVRCLIAKVINNQDIDSPRTHRICLLEWKNEQYLIDVGFGANCPRKPIKIEAGYVSIHNGVSYRIVVNSNQDFQLEIDTGFDSNSDSNNGFYSLYTFNLNRYTEADCFMGNFYSSNYPGAVFVNNLVVSLVLPEITLSLRNSQYHRISIDNTDVTHINDHLQLQRIIKDDFDIELSENESNIIYQKTCTK